MTVNIFHSSFILAAFVFVHIISYSHTLPDKCSYNEVRCNSSSLCIMRNAICDERIDCLEGEDEEKTRCLQLRGSAWKAPCPNPRMFRCVTSGKCFDMNKRCDGVVNCRDGSDERDCASIQQRSCGEGLFYCGALDPMGCIDSSRVCDSRPDCFNEADERNCTIKRCKPNEFRCKVEHSCIYASFRCDKTAHCRDGSDEDPAMCKLDGKKNCTNEEFDCTGDASNCIPQSLVCNGKNDCGRSEDENPALCSDSSCAQLTKGANKCQQVCRERGGRGVCACRSGYRLMSDERSCEDIDECAEVPGACSQKCLNTRGSFQCTCIPGYTKDPQDDARCIATGEKRLLFVADSSIKELRMLHNEKWSLVAGVETAVAIDYDLSSHPQRLFWSEMRDNKLGLATLDEHLSVEPPNVTYIHSEDQVSVEGIAFDWVNKLLFLADMGRKGRNTSRILVMNMTNRVTVELAREGISSARSVAVSPQTGRIFWTDCGSQPRIEEMRMDGSGRKLLVKTGLGLPTGLALDHTTNRLYWSDSQLGTIASIDLTTGQRTTLLHSTNYQPFSLVVFEDLVYWTDWNHHSIYSLNKFTGNQTSRVIPAQGPMGIRMLHKLAQPHSRGACIQHVCSHVCLPSSGKDFSCRCPNGWKLEDDKSTCYMIPLRSDGSRRTTGSSSNTLLVISLVIVTLLVLAAVGLIVRRRLKDCRITSNEAAVSFSNPVYMPTTEPIIESVAACAVQIDRSLATSPKGYKQLPRFDDGSSWVNTINEA